MHVKPIHDPDPTPTIPATDDAPGVGMPGPKPKETIR